MNYRIIWDNGHACGTLAGSYTSRAMAESAARMWQREMLDIEPDTESRREARAVYSWEIIKEDDR